MRKKNCGVSSCQTRQDPHKLHRRRQCSVWAQQSRIVRSAHVAVAVTSTLPRTGVTIRQRMFATVLTSLKVLSCERTTIHSRFLHIQYHLVTKELLFREIGPHKKLQCPLGVSRRRLWHNLIFEITFAKSGGSESERRWRINGKSTRTQLLRGRCRFKRAFCPASLVGNQQETKRDFWGTLRRTFRSQLQPRSDRLVPRLVCKRV